MALAAFCIILIVVVGIAGYGMMKSVSGEVGCLATAQVAHESIKEYAKETGKYPDASNWQEVIDSYYQANADDFKKNLEDAGPMADQFSPDGNEGALDCSEGDTRTSLYYNAALSNVPTDKADPDTVLIYEDVATEARNASGEYKEKPKSSSPKMMGRPRGWYSFTINENLDFNNSPGSGTETENSSSSKGTESGG